jgi:hypothetical protein
VAVESNLEAVESNPIKDLDVEVNLGVWIVQWGVGEVTRIHGIAKSACSQLGQQSRSNNRLYSFPTNSL